MLMGIDAVARKANAESSYRLRAQPSYRLLWCGRYILNYDNHCHIHYLPRR
ncbi:hypothetical protein BGLA2_270038 [Burkholderia gladioli]|nr:hypothetical protein BGLA2_270038 [Burkholderia gladioli]